MQTPENFILTPENKEATLQIFAQLHQAFTPLLDDFFDKKITQQEYLSKQEEVIRNFADKHKDILRAVFQTDSGSWYFWSKSGLSLRVKKDKQRHVYIDQPVMEKLYFLSAEHYREASRALNLMESKDPQFFSVDLAPGVYPLELSTVNRTGEAPNYQIKEEPVNDGTMVKIILDRSDETYVVPCPYHVGHPVSEIIK
ncbi:MAG TPA: hypothetical protein PL066_01775 [bacterium]|nr:hypothetical protein [bacterium]